MRLPIYVGVGGVWTIVGGLWKWIGEVDCRSMVVDEFITLSELHNRIYEKFEIKCDEFKLKLSVCRKNKQSIKPSYVKDNEDLEAFLLGRSKNTIDTTLHVSNEPRRVVEGNVGSNDQSENKLPVKELAYIE